MNKKESKQYRAVGLLVTERRQRSSDRVAQFQSSASSVGKGLTLIGISSTVQVYARWTDYCLMIDAGGSKARNRDL